MADEVTFVPALPGWEALFYLEGDAYESAPILAWGIIVDDAGVYRVSPVTVDGGWVVDDYSRAIRDPEGTVTDNNDGEATYRTVSEWLDDMKIVQHSMKEADIKNLPQDDAGPVTLNLFRGKFRKT